jgi:hypothetical protein
MQVDVAIGSLLSANAANQDDVIPSDRYGGDNGPR